MHPYIPQAQPYAVPSYQQAAPWPVQQVPTPGTAVTALALSIVVFVLAVLASPLTLIFSAASASLVNEPDFSGTGDLVVAMLLAFAPLGLPAILGAFLAMFPRVRMPKELFPSSGTRTAATVFLILHLLTLMAAVILGLLPQILVLTA
ncbi:hypothetical protein [Kocuria palustris]|uniref:hypothetical protein n=1 Tax=Kocuria palustris TaxID=71999 RepID=UPI0011A4865A|nr:hypothetical protein [Kocuria palustris]